MRRCYRVCLLRASRRKHPRLTAFDQNREANLNSTISVSDIIDEYPLSRFQIVTIGLCGAVLILDGFDAQCIGFLAPSISETLSIPLKNFGPVFGASLVGLMIAALAIGPIADRWGRKWPVIISTLLFASFTVMTARVTSLNELVILRFLTGLGLGGAMPNVVSLTSEYAPKRLQSVVVAMLFCGMPAGALLAGMVSTVAIPAWGWRSVFYFGGFIPLALLPALIKALPESVLFLSERRPNSRRIFAFMAKIAPDVAEERINMSVPTDLPRKGLPIKHLFTEGRALGTILLWVPFFMNLLIIYFIVSWLPSFLRQAGQPVSMGVTAISLFSLGGIVGCLAEGRLMNAFGAYIILVVEFGLSVLLIAALAFTDTSFLLIMGVTFVLGCSVQGAQAALNAVAASFYPTPMRSTGVGWALGVGRVGSIVGPVLGGVLLSMDWTPRQILLTGMLPAFSAGVAILLTSSLRGDAAPYRAEPDVEEVP